MTNPSIWTPGQAVSAESSNRMQTFIASLGQEDFTITNFTYETGTNSLEVDVSGVTQRPGIDFIETGSNSFSLTSPIEEEGTSVFVRGLIDVSGNPQVISDAANVSYLTETVKTALDARLPEIASYAALRLYNGIHTALNMKCRSTAFDQGAGVFRVVSGDISTADDDGVVIIDAVGRRWKRDFQGAANLLWWGAKGDGVTDDTSAITKALNWCSDNLKRLYVPGGRTYLMTYYYKSGHYHVDMFSDPANRARFLTTNAAALAGARQFRFLGPEDITGLTITADVKPNLRSITLNSVAGLAKGMTLLLSSGRMWPYDNRGDYTCGELHEIIAVNSDTNTVTFRDSTRDSYLTTDSVVVSAWTPNYASFEHIIFEQPSVADGTGGLMFSRTANARVVNCWAYGNDFYQIHNVHSIDTTYERVSVGPAYNVDEGGYGIYDLSNLGTRIRNLASYGLRAAYDSHTTSTGQAPNRDVIIDGFVIRGGGDAVYPDGASECRGIGMHGPSENVRFMNGFISDVQIGIRVRGKGTSVNNVNFSGYMQTVFGLSHGTGLTAESCVYDSLNWPNKIGSLNGINPDSRITQFIDFGIVDGVGGSATVNGTLSGSTLNYDAEVYPFTKGTLLTGATSGATAYITNVVDNGSTGVLTLTNISGTFQDNEVITTAGYNNWDFSMPVVLKNNTVVGLDGYFMKFTTNQEVYNLDVQGNNIRAIPGSADTAYLMFADTTRYVYKSVIKNNQFEALNGSTAYHNNNLYLGFSATASIKDRGVEVADRQWVLRVANQAVGKLRFNLTTGVDRPNIWIASDGGGTKLLNIIKESASLTSWAGSTFANLVGTATGSSLTGTTGTSGNVTIGLMNNGDFYLENQTGSARTYRVVLAS